MEKEKAADLSFGVSAKMKSQGMIFLRAQCTVALKGRSP
jgi:hypothetical protein